MDHGLAKLKNEKYSSSDEISCIDCLHYVRNFFHLYEKISFSWKFNERILQMDSCVRCRMEKQFVTVDHLDRAFDGTCSSKKSFSLNTWKINRSILFSAMASPVFELLFRVTFRKEQNLKTVKPHSLNLSYTLFSLASRRFSGGSGDSVTDGLYEYKLRDNLITI